MRNWLIISYVMFIVSCCSAQLQKSNLEYLRPIVMELQKKWPENRTVNLVFHGHSVPSGYLTKGVVDTFGSYPYLTLKKLKDNYDYAVINAITTAIGGEQSEQGAERFTQKVLSHRPDVVFIDYALNDRSIGLARAKLAWEKMIMEAKAYGAKVILMTPTPDLTKDIGSADSELKKHSVQIRNLAKTHNVGLVDSYHLFQEIAKKEDLETYMAQKNHINRKGHDVVAHAIAYFFKKNTSD